MLVLVVMAVSLMTNTWRIALLEGFFFYASREKKRFVIITFYII